MQNQPRSLAVPSRLRPFSRAAGVPLSVPPAADAPASGAAAAWNYAARLVRPVPAQPVLVDKVPALPVLSPASALAHDARNALTSLELLAGLLAEPGVLAAGSEHYAADMHTVAQALSGMIDRMESLATVAPAQIPKAAGRLTAGAGKRAATAGDALTQYASVLRGVAGHKVQVHISAESRLPPLALEDDALLRVLLNLVKNASEAMPDGGTVRITGRRALSAKAPAVLIHVTDDGPGIPALFMPSIFKPGFTSKRATKPGERCGLGLAIVRELVEAAGGEVLVASKRHSGTTFELRLPCLP